MVSIDEIATFCKRRGFIYPNSEIYGGVAGFFDYGPLGVELKNNIKQQWWKFHVHSRSDMVGIDGSIITHPKVWEASGHVASFSDIMIECENCHERYRADQLIEDQLKIKADGLSVDKINSLMKTDKLTCPSCKKDKLSDASRFNLMFQTYIGPKKSEESVAYLRPETAQLMFVDFKLVQENARLKLPFGIAQVGKAFRNEISPRNFLFRCREFEQMEIEYFVHPEKREECPYLKEVLNHELLIYSEEMQKNNFKPKKMKISEALKKKIIRNPWHAYWLATEHKWFVSLGANKENFRIRQHLKDELSHYSSDTWDLEYNFPFGWKELQGIADRADYDLQQHMKHSKKDLSLFDEENKKKIVPQVISEPSLGVDRTFLVFLFDAYNYDKKRENIVLKLHPKLAPYKLAVFPLLSNRPELVEKAKEVFDLLKEEFTCFFDESGSIGRRYFRQDEVGTLYGITIDFDSLKKEDITIRERDSTKQIRVKIKDLKDTIKNLLNSEIKFEKAGKIINTKNE
ncbi:glycine--tRNA ligase [Candidatus Woesearchaeota archaeon]|nr:glycine--tRNA ligase [Candidatus Woesearchaeota archaeon]